MADEVITYEPGTEGHYRSLVERLGMDPGEAREVVDMAAGRSYGDRVEVDPVTGLEIVPSRAPEPAAEAA
jgi:hypothetical protein